MQIFKTFKMEYILKFSSSNSFTLILRIFVFDSKYRLKDWLSKSNSLIIKGNFKVVKENVATVKQIT